MFKLRPFPALLLATTALLAVSACDEDRRVIVGPPGDDSGVSDGITGVVRDADGRPVAAAAIGLIYKLDGYALPGDRDPDKPQTQISFDLPETDLIRLIILDNAGDPVRSLVDENTAEIPDVIIWDATDDAGRPVPVGRYVCRAVFADQTRLERVIFCYDYEIPTFLDKPNTLTGDDGAFRVPRDLVPVGADIPIYAEDGTFLDLYPVSPGILVVAVIEYGGVMYQRTAPISLAEDQTWIAVDFIFPFSQ